MSLNWVKEIEGVNLFESVDLAKYTTIKLKAIGDIATVESIDALTLVIQGLQKHGIEYHVLGWGANQVISKTKNTLFIKLKLPLDRDIFKTVHKFYDLPASTPLNLLQSHAQKFGLKGWEVLTGIPASLGGAIYMNAGTALGEICNIVESVTILEPTGKVRVEKINENSFSYRKNHFVSEGEIIIEARLLHHGEDPKISQKIKEYMSYRKSTQPLASFNCGCVWKNYDANHKAGLVIDKLKLNLLKINDLEVSDKHCNFLENKGSATFEDFNALIGLTKEELLLHTGIKFELEAKIY
ncbi:MAG: FAD-binding protein [Bacteriovoracaceae bacterium]|nr:FAD-binding protein [Bacteriovoracaceae bacterium]